NYLYFRVSDMTEYQSAYFGNCKFVSEEIYLALQRYELFENELVISIAGTIGKIQIVDNFPANKKVILTENCAKLSIKDNSILRSKYLSLVLQTDFVQQQIIASSIQTTIPKLGLDKILTLKIPKLPDIRQQEKCVSLMDNAISEKEKAYDKAKTLLNSINDYLLDELQIDLPKIDNCLKSRIFTVQMSKVSGGQFDVQSQFNKYFRIQGGKYENKRLDKLAFLQKGQSITSDDVIEGDYPVIAGGQTSPYNHHSYNHSGNVITVSASGSAGYVWYHDYPIFASDCTMIFSKNEDEILTEFLAEILKLKQQEIYRLAKGGVQVHVYAKDLALLQIPVPDLATQQKIIIHIRQIRQQASDLYKQADETLAKTKADIERMILGGQ
ncbi:restriction endonuclease subunit S, partial [Moraxella caviae]